MKPVALLSFLLAVSTLSAAGPDIEGMQRERAALDQRNTRENQRIEQAQEEAMIPVRAKVRDLKAKAEREVQAASMALAPALLAGKAEIETKAVEDARFAVLEADNLEVNQFSPEAMEPFDTQRQAWSREYDLGIARIEAKLYDGIEGGEKARAATLRKAEVMAKWSEKSSALDLEVARAERKIQKEYTTRINRVEARIAGLGAKAAAAMNARIREKASKGQAPTAEDLMPPKPDPAVPAAEAERDELRNALETELEKLRASFNPRRNEIDNQREEELAKVGG